MGIEGMASTVAWPPAILLTSQSVRGAIRRRRTPEERPGQILDAALAVFGERGLAAARVEEIAERAGISKGTVYLYFKSKDELFKEVVRAFWVEMLGSIVVGEKSHSPVADVRQMCGSFWSFLRSPRFATAHRLVAAEIQGFPDIAQEYAEEVREPILQTLREVLDRGVRAGVFARGDNLVRARMLFSLLMQHAVWRARGRFLRDLSTRSDDQVLEEVLEFFLDATVISR